MGDARDPIYLDHNATTPILPEVVDAMLPYLRTHFGNPSSGHAYGKRAKDAVERARAEIAAAIGASADEIVLTSGGTEANNLAIVGACEARAKKDGASPARGRNRIVTSAVEHPATLEPCAMLARRGWRVERVGVDGEGRVREDDARAAIDDGVALVTVMHANNEVGTIEPVRALADAAHARGAVVHTDAAQSLGKIEVDVDALGVDLLSIAGHKLYAPKGVGALYVRRGVEIEPFSRGAGQERGIRPGTEAVAQIVALGEACRIARASLHGASPARSEGGPRLVGARAHLAARARELWERLAARVPGLALNGPRAETERLPNTLNVSFPGARGADVLARAPGVAASTGSACHAGEETPSAVLTAMGLDRARALGAVRLSVGRATTADDVARAADELARAWESLRG